METKKHIFSYIKRQAKELIKEQGISHTAAFELKAKEYGYSNWQHCCRSFDRIPPTIEPEKPVDYPEISFTQRLIRS